MIDILKKNYDICFNDSLKYSAYVFANKYKEENAVYHTVNGKIVSQLFIVYKKLIIRGKIISCPYICGLCTPPDYQNKGYAAIVLEKCFERLIKEGHSICALHPFKHSYYEKFGFNTYTKVKKYLIKFSGGDILLKNANKSDVTVISKLYNAFMKNKSGYVYRDNTDTINRLAEMKVDGKCKLIYDGGKIAGYAFFDKGLIEEYCADKKYLDSIKDFDGYNVYLPINSEKGVSEDFTMIKLLNRQLYLLQTEGDTEVLKSLNDFQLIHATLGSYKDFSLQLPQKVINLYPEMINFVFDKY